MGRRNEDRWALLLTRMVVGNSISGIQSKKFLPAKKPVCRGLAPEFGIERPGESMKRVSMRRPYLNFDDTFSPDDIKDRVHISPAPANLLCR